MLAKPLRYNLTESLQPRSVTIRVGDKGTLLYYLAEIWGLFLESFNILAQEVNSFFVAPGGRKQNGCQLIKDPCA
jgi:hypothetical protein